MFFRENNKQLCDSLKRMANKCQKLKSIKCKFDITSPDLDIRQSLSPLKNFSCVEKDWTYFFSYDDFVDVFELSQKFSFEAFKGLSNITHLTLRFYEYCNKIKIKGNILTDIDEVLPNLQYLELFNKINATPEEVTQMADILSRLSRLHTLKLVFSEGIDYKEIEVKIREKCRKIRTIHINQYF